MEVRPGYKQTDLGVIPADWEVADLQKICGETITYGIVQCGPHIENGVPYIRVSDMNSPNLDVSGMLRTSPSIASQFSRSQVKDGDVVYALRGKIGEVRSVGQAVSGANLTQGTARLSPSGRVNSTYLLYCLRSEKALRQGDLAAKGSTFREITLEALRRIQIPVASLIEQRAIAAALSDVDALLAKLDALVAKKRDLKVAAMQQLLTGQTRLPGFSGEWEVKRLGDVAELLKGSGLSKGACHASGIRKCILYGELFTTYGQIIVEVVGRTNSPDGRLSEAGDVLVPGSTTTDGIDLATASALLENGIALGGDINIIRCKSKSDFNAQFLANYLTNVKKQAIAERAQGTTIVHLYGRDLADLPIDCPGLEEQSAIASVLFDMDAELTALEARRDKTHALKQGLMQELLTGRIRLV